MIWSWAMPSLALAALAVLVWRILRIRDERVVMVLLGLVFMGLTLVLNTATIYLAIDAGLGGRNLTYWIVQVAWMASMLFFAMGFAWRAAIIWKKFLVVLFVPAAFLGVVAVFLMPEAWGSVPRLAGYRDQPEVLLLTTPTNIFSVYAAVLIIIVILRSLRHSQSRTLRQRIGLISIVGGFASGLVSASLRFWALGSSSSDNIVALDGVFVLATIGLILTGCALMASNRFYPRDAIGSDLL
jgi:hypothetical protein